jgi:hypothetical protein
VARLASSVLVLLAALPSNLRGAQNEFVIHGIEIVQAIQSMGQDVQLISGKQTWVRVYLGAEVSVPTTVRGLLQVRDLTTGTTGKIRSLNALTILPGETFLLQPKRENLQMSLNFAVPSSLTGVGRCEFSFSGVVDAASGASYSCPTCQHYVRKADFTQSAPLRVKIVGIPYEAAEQGSQSRSYEPSVIDYAMVESWLRRAYPAGKVIVTREVLQSPRKWPLACYGVNAELSEEHDARTHYIGLVSNAGGLMMGCSDIFSFVGSAPVGDPRGPNAPKNVGGETDGSFGGWYAGHELAHQLGLQHPGFCRGQVDDENGKYPYPCGQLSDDKGSYVGLDVGDPVNRIEPTLLPGESNYDIMTYCTQPQWPSKYTYDRIRETLNDEDSLGPGDFDGPHAPTDWRHGKLNEQVRNRVKLKIGNLVSIVATLNLTRRTGQILYASHVTRALVRTDKPDDTAVLRFTDASGKVFVYPEWVLASTDTPVGEDETALVDAVEPEISNLTKLQLLLFGKVIDELQVPSEAPVIHRLRVHSLGSNTLAVALDWMVEPSVAPRMNFRVDNSIDGGRTWNTVALGLHDKSLVLPAGELPGLSSTLVRVTANDGYNDSEPLVSTLVAPAK